MSRPRDFYDPRQPSSWAPLPSRNPRMPASPYNFGSPYAFPIASATASASAATSSGHQSAQSSPSSSSVAAYSHEQLQATSSGTPTSAVPGSSVPAAHYSSAYHGQSTANPRYYDIYAHQQQQQQQMQSQIQGQGQGQGQGQHQSHSQTPSSSSLASFSSQSTSNQTLSSNSALSSTVSTNHTTIANSGQTMTSSTVDKVDNSAYSSSLYDQIGSLQDQLGKEKEKALRLEGQMRALSAQVEEIKTTKIILEEQNKALRNQVQELTAQSFDRSSSTQNQSSQRMIEWLQSELEIYKTRLSQETQLRIKAEQALTQSQPQYQSQAQSQSQSQSQSAGLSQASTQAQQGKLFSNQSYNYGTAPSASYRSSGSFSNTPASPTANTPAPGLTGGIATGVGNMSLQSQRPPSSQQPGTSQLGTNIPVANPLNSAAKPPIGATTQSAAAPATSFSNFRTDADFGNPADDLNSPRKGVHRVLSESKLKLPKFLKNMTSTKKKKDDDEFATETNAHANPNANPNPNASIPSAQTNQGAKYPPNMAAPYGLNAGLPPQHDGNRQPTGESDSRAGIRRVVSESLLSDGHAGASGGNAADSGDAFDAFKKSLMGGFGHKKPHPSNKPGQTPSFAMPPPPAHGILRTHPTSGTPSGANPSELPGQNYAATGLTAQHSYVAPSSAPQASVASFSQQPQARSIGLGSVPPTTTSSPTMAHTPPQQQQLPVAGNQQAQFFAPRSSMSSNPEPAPSDLSSSASNSQSAASNSRPEHGQKKQVRFQEDPAVQEKRDAQGFFFFNPNAPGGGQWGRK